MNTTSTYTTIADLIDQEIVPALDSTNVDPTELADRLCDAGQITYDEAAQGFRLAVDADGNTPGFWELVAELDAE